MWSFAEEEIDCTRMCLPRDHIRFFFHSDRLYVICDFTMDYLAHYNYYYKIANFDPRNWV